MLAEILNLAGSPTAAPYRDTRVLSPLYTGQEFQPEWDIEKAAEEALQKSAMVDRCVTGKADKAASLPLRVWERDEVGKAAPVADHHLDDLLNYPSRDAVSGSREEMVSRAVQHYELAGQALIGIVRGRDVLAGNALKPVNLVAEDPREIYPVPAPQIRIRQWNYRTGDGRSLAWRREDLCQWKRHDPRNDVWGRSRLQSLALTVDSSVEAARTHLLRMARDGRPGMTIADDSITTPVEGREAEDMLNARMRTRRGGIMLLGGSQKLIAMGMSSPDLGLLDSMAFDRDMIAIAFGYLPAGFSNEASTYANSGIFVLHEWGLVQALMSSFCDRLGAFLMTREERRRYFIRPDYSEVQALQDATLEKLSALKDLAFTGISTNDLIRALGLPLRLQKDGDEPLVPKNVRVLSAVLRGAET